MRYPAIKTTDWRRTLIALLWLSPFVAAADETHGIDLLGLDQGVVPAGMEGSAKALGISLEQALQVIDGDDRTFVLTRKPGGADTTLAFIYALPASTTFQSFAVPNVLETPSPSQTFVKMVEIGGSAAGPRGPFRELAKATLTTHATSGETTTIPATVKEPVRWLRVTLTGGLNIERDKTFFEFSEIAGYGEQEPVPLSHAFSGEWKERGIKLELKQEGVRVSGCYDGIGDLNGTVNGNVLRATGKSRSGAIPSTFVLSVGGDGEIIGVRSTNGAPFRLYTAPSAKAAGGECSKRVVTPIGCGSVIHGINFDFDSATIRPESEPLITALYAGLKSSQAASITVIGHTSSEGSETYRDDLSKRRAAAVTAALAARGIDAARIAAEGRGEKQPLADNTSELGRSLNRRVEIACR